MDESYQQLLESERKRRQNSSVRSIARHGLRLGQKALVAGMVLVFGVRSAFDAVVSALRFFVLFPFDLVLRALFSLWCRNRSSATSTHLDLERIRQAFWNGDSIVVAAGMRTFFIKITRIETETPDPPTPGQTVPAQALPSPGPRAARMALDLPARKRRVKRNLRHMRSAKIAPMASGTINPETIKRFHRFRRRRQDPHSKDQSKDPQFNV